MSTRFDGKSAEELYNAGGLWVRARIGSTLILVGFWRAAAWAYDRSEDEQRRQDARFLHVDCSPGRADPVERVLLAVRALADTEWDLGLSEGAVVTREVVEAAIAAEALTQ